MNLTKEKKASWELKPHWIWSVLIYGVLGAGLGYLALHVWKTYLF